MIKLVDTTISNEELDVLADWIRTHPRLTKDHLTIEFEQTWNTYLGTTYSVFVNSGSSANLLMLYALKIAEKLPTGKVVVPSLSWATDLAPVMQLGLDPILCDCNMENLSVDVKHLEEIFKQEQPDCLLLVSVLGLVPDMDKIVSLCEQYNVILLEDACESLGSTYYGRKLGTFGTMSTFSFYFGHHISTIEGGMISTNDPELGTILKMLRSHGWSRDLDETNKKVLKEKYNVTDFDELYTFYIPGFNVRATDLQAFIGLRQIKTIPHVVDARNKNYLYYQENIRGEWKPTDNPYCFTSNFAYPIISKNRTKLVKALQDNNIETRPLICGSMHMQPFYYTKDYRKDMNLPNGERITQEGIYVPNHPNLSIEDLEKLVKVVNSSI